MCRLCEGSVVHRCRQLWRYDRCSQMSTRMKWSLCRWMKGVLACGFIAEGRCVSPGSRTWWRWPWTLCVSSLSLSLSLSRCVLLCGGSLRGACFRLLKWKQCEHLCLLKEVLATGRQLLGVLSSFSECYLQAVHIMTEKGSQLILMAEVRWGRYSRETRGLRLRLLTLAFDMVQSNSK